MFHYLFNISIIQSQIVSLSNVPVAIDSYMSNSQSVQFHLSLHDSHLIMLYLMTERV